MALKIMAVDDEGDVLKLLRALLEPMGCEVLTFEDSREAARLLEKEKFDGIVLDAHMPHIDGFQLAQLVRDSRLNHQVPLIMITGYSDVTTMRKGFNSGVSFFLGKPFNRERIGTLFGAARGAMLQEKRKYARLPLHATVNCRYSGHRHGQFVSGSLDISEEGMFMAPSGGLDVDNELEVEFDIPTGKTPVKTRAKVVRREKPDSIAIEFIALPQKDLVAIKRYISVRVRG